MEWIIENEYSAKGYKIICGTDEAGARTALRKRRPPERDDTALRRRYSRTERLEEAHREEAREALRYHNLIRHSVGGR